ncbi:hypothetical protein GALL_393240 [mine drainage metagenome]|uniref:Uncharacterized protein n=1 Tax=mine drainage metagenome TaxID=410659 RepID=A0A1J5QG60_9ZZZZ
MSFFHSKEFQGTQYTFDHLDPFVTSVSLDAAGSKVVELDVTFSCHCFTEAFDESLHQDHHRYRFQGELRAFDVLRYACSLQLPTVIAAMFRGRIHRGDGSLTYVAYITLSDAPGEQPYSVFFSLERDDSKPGNVLAMRIKSAYLKSLVAKANAQSWRFVSLAGEVSGLFVKVPKTRPRKKAP